MEKYKGKWFIQEMDLWDKEFIDLVTPGYIEIDSNGSGEIQFGCVNAQLDYCVNSKGNEERLDFSFDGQDEGDPINGRGFAKIRDKSLVGRIFIYMGDESDFVAQKK
jgi:hypothetical protein